MFAYLEHGRGVPRDAIVIGPRGNGKTALLRWFQQEIEAGSGADVVWLTPSDIEDLDSLATELVPLHRFESLRPETLSFSIGIGRLGWELGDRPASLTRLLMARCKRRPLVTLLDEAHNLDKRVANVLLNASQSVTAEAPFLLVLAGTPELQMRLNEVSATFWNRAKQIGIGRLDATATAAALTRPFAKQEPPVTFEAGALGKVVAETQGYPYFVQLWGDALWNAANDIGATVIHTAIVEAASVAFGSERENYYEDRRNELEQRDLLGVAASVASAFRRKETLSGGELRAAIASAQPDGATTDALRLEDGLASVGYVWRRPGAGNRWEPGIPNLMTYVEAASAQSP